MASRPPIRAVSRRTGLGRRSRPSPGVVDDQIDAGRRLDRADVAPSRPISLPFMSSVGRCTSEIVRSATNSPARRSIATATTSPAVGVGVRLLLDLPDALRGLVRASAVISSSSALAARFIPAARSSARRASSGSLHGAVAFDAALLLLQPELATLDLDAAGLELHDLAVRLEAAPPDASRSPRAESVGRGCSLRCRHGSSGFRRAPAPGPLVGRSQPRASPPATMRSRDSSALACHAIEARTTLPVDDGRQQRRDLKPDQAGLPMVTDESPWIATARLTHFMAVGRQRSIWSCRMQSHVGFARWCATLGTVSRAVRLCPGTSIKPAARRRSHRGRTAAGSAIDSPTRRTGPAGPARG